MAIDPNISEKELIEGCVAYDRDYQEAFYRKFADKMYGVSFSYAENEAEACDILQEGFIRIFRKIDKYSFEGSLEGWVRKVIVNTALEFYRKKKREREVFEEFGKTVESKIDDIIGKINAGEIIKLVNALPRKAAMVMKLYAVEGYNHKEIALEMNISEGTSKSQLNRARTLLKEAINRQHGHG